MTHRYALTVAGAVALALGATPMLAETTDPHEAFHAWRNYCLDVERPKNEAAARYCSGFRIAVGSPPHQQASGLGAALSLALAAGDVQVEPAADEATDAPGLSLPEQVAAETVVPQDRPRPGFEGDSSRGVPIGGR